MIALITDFGNDYYHGVVKGKILSWHKNAQITDLSHNVASCNSRNGAWILLQSYPHFPKNTIFLAIVDPGVGSQRKALVVETRNYLFVGPDNGLLYPAAKDDGIIDIMSIPLPKNASKTFHGRDLFAKIASQLEKGSKPRTLGNKQKTMQQISLVPKSRKGEIMHIDSFGNIITNLASLQKKEYVVSLNNKSIAMPFFQTYDMAAENELFLIEGSSNTLEISIKGESAQKLLQAKLNQEIEIR